MNFDTKYLIRWGIPGWLMVMNLLPYFIIIYFKPLTKHVSNSSDLLTIGAVLTVLGVPLGYLLNQIHHSLFWVVPRLKNNLWEGYFNEELKIDEYFNRDEKTKEDKARYRYLLSRKHELGGICVSMGISSLVLFLTNIFGNYQSLWSWLYFMVVSILFIIMLLSRQYSSKNINTYHQYYLNK
jgi:O-antigen/teichoic acid export membrane protein